MSEKQFSEEEVQEIIKRAVKLQQKEDETEKPTSVGLTLDEVISVGKEAGLDVHNIKMAALETQNQKVTRYSGISDTYIFEERELVFPINVKSAWKNVIAELRHNFGGNTFGQTQIDDHKFEWSHTSISGIETLASLTEKDGSYRLRLSQRVGMASSLTEGVVYGSVASGVLAATIAGIFSLNGALEISFVFAALLVPLCILIYTLDVAWRKKKLGLLKELADKIASQLQDSFHASKEHETTRIEIESGEERNTTSDKNATNLKLRS